jgi:methylamine utilization protein MauE
MTQLLMDVQVVVLAVVLGLASIAKLTLREPVAERPAEVHGVPVPPEPRRVLALRQSRTAMFAAALGEGALAVALLVSSHVSVRVVVTLAFIAGTWTVNELRTLQPEAGCGCFGKLSNRRIGSRNVARAALLAGLAVVSLGAGGAGIEVLGADPGPVCLLLGLELAIIAALSPEVAELRRGKPPAPPCERRPSPLAESYAALHSSDAWRRHQALLTGQTPLDVWREACWRFLVFPARLDDQAVELVFAVSTQERDRTVRVTVMEAEWSPDYDEDLEVANEDTGPNPQYAMT